MRNDDSSTETESESDTEEDTLSEFNESIEQESDRLEVQEEAKDKKMSNVEKIEALK